MKRFFLNPALLLCTAFGFVSLGSVAAQTATEKTDAGNLYLSGDEIRIAEPVAADLFAAGRHISIENPVAADGALAGRTVEIKAGIGQDLRVAAGIINIDGRVGGDLLAGGATVKLSPSSAVGGTTLIAGRDVSLDGQLAHGAKVYAGKVAISGRIAGNTRLYAQEITLAPAARIEGDLVYASARPLPEEQLAQVSGKVVREKTPEGWEPAATHPERSGMAFHPFVFLSLLAFGSLLFILFPNAVTSARQTIKRHPWRSLLIGLALLFSLPPVAVLFMITVIGIPIGLGLLALYPLLLLLGYLGTAFFIGREAADVLKQPRDFTPGRQIAFLAVALLVLAVASMVPVLGGMVMFLALVTGLGGWAVSLHQRYRNGGGTQDTGSVEV